MATEIVHQPPGAVAPLNTPPHIAMTEAVLQNLLGGTYSMPTIERLPTAQERGRLHERSMQIRSLLRPGADAVADRDRISAAVGELIGGWLNLRTDGPETIAGFTAKLQELPAWAVAEACRDFQEGRATFEVDGKVQRSSPEYAPSSATIFLVARQKMDAVLAEQAMINRIMTAKLAAPDEDPVEREKVAGLIKDLATNMGTRQEAYVAAAERESRDALAAAKGRAAKFRVDADARRLARYAELGLKPVYVGDKLCDADALPARLQVMVEDASNVSLD